MHTAKTLLLLRLLSPAQFRKLGKMVRSPFFTTNPNLVTLYKYLQPLYPEFDSPKLDKERMFQKVFPKHKYSDIKLRNLLREMTKLVEDLLIYYKLETEEFKRKKMLAEIYQEEKQDKLFHREMHQLQSAINDHPYKDEDFFEEAFKLDMLEMEHLQSKDLKKRVELLNGGLEHLENFYQLNKTILKTELKMLSRFWSIPDKNTSTETAPILFNIYTKIYALLETKKLEIFYEIKQLLLEHLDQIRVRQQLDILLYLISYAIGNMRLDDRFYNTLVFELYQFGFDHGILSQKGHISDLSFLNTCIAGAKAGSFEWTYDFIQRHESMLSPSTRADIKKLGLSNLKFHQGEFTTAIELLDDLQINDAQLYISTKLHLLRCYYELSIKDGTYQELFIDQTFAFEKIVRRNRKFTSEKIQSYLNFTQFLRQLAKQRSIGKLPVKLQEKLLETLQNQSITISRSWLTEKIKN